MRLELTEWAKSDLDSGHDFYEQKSPGIGEYFLDTLYSDIESLYLYAGTHPIRNRRFYRMLSSRFPYAVFYELRGDLILVVAVLDWRRKPAWTGRLLSRRRRDR